MFTSTISETKNRLSELLGRVRGGETLLILDRKKPVARIEPVKAGEDNPALEYPAEQWDPAAVLSLPVATPVKKDSPLSRAVAEERESGW